MLRDTKVILNDPASSFECIKKTIKKHTVQKEITK